MVGNDAWPGGRPGRRLWSCRRLVRPKPEDEVRREMESSFMRFDDTENIATLASAYDSPSNPVAI